MTVNWTSGNTFTLLENGEEFFPRVFEALRAAQKQVVVETFILFDDKVGRELRQIIIEIAQRGVRVDVTVDGYGSADLTPEFIGGMTTAGAGFHIFDPQPRRFGLRTNVFRRMHRKIVVIDATVAFVGGINYGVDHLAEFGPQAKQDYAVELRGPLVDDIVRFVAGVLAPVRPRFWHKYRRQAQMSRERQEGPARAAFIIRDNDRHTRDIELHYRMGIRSAQREIIIANAYFFPSYRFLRDLRQAAQRGVCVRLILQGEPDMPIVKFAASMLYDYLLSAGVKIYEYCERPLHGKVATVDGEWATVGSSNLDPLSLALNLEANVMIRDAGFSASLRDRLEELIKNKCSSVERKTRPTRKIERVLVSVFVFHFLRRFPAWAGRLPWRKPELTSVSATTDTDQRGET